MATHRNMKSSFVYSTIPAFVVLIGLLVGQAAVAGETASRDAALSRAKMASDPLVAGLSACRDAACLRDVAATHISSAVFAGAKVHPLNPATAAAADVSLAECLVEGVGDVLTCDAVFDEVDDPEGFWLCVGAAAGKFINCTGVLASESASVREMSVQKFGLDLMIQVAESPEGRNRAGRLAVSHDGQHVIIERSDEPTVSTQLAQAAASFGDCATAFRNNRAVCNNIFANDDDARAVCLAGTVTVFNNCVGNLMAM